MAEIKQRIFQLTKDKINNDNISNNIKKGNIMDIFLQNNLSGFLKFLNNENNSIQNFINGYKDKINVNLIKYIYEINNNVKKIYQFFSAVILGTIFLSFVVVFFILFLTRSITFPVFLMTMLGLVLLLFVIKIIIDYNVNKYLENIKNSVIDKLEEEENKIIAGISNFPNEFVQFVNKLN